MPRRITGNCAKHQREISTAVNRARMIALMPFTVTGELIMPMQVILKQDVNNLGKSGEVVKVKPGYGRNYLLPRGLAVIGDRCRTSSASSTRRP